MSDLDLLQRDFESALARATEACRALGAADAVTGPDGGKALIDEAARLVWAALEAATRLQTEAQRILALSRGAVKRVSDLDASMISRLPEDVWPGAVAAGLHLFREQQKADGRIARAAARARVVA